MRKAALTFAAAAVVLAGCGGTDGSASTGSACRQVAALAADVRDRTVIDGDEFHAEAVEIRDTARAGHDDTVTDGAQHAVDRAASGEVSMSALDPVSQACLDGGHMD